MKFKLRENLGMSLVEIMVAVAITGIVSLVLSSMYTNYVNQKFSVESKAIAQADIDTTSKFIKTYLPGLISNTVGPNGNINPAANWTCPSGGPCTLDVLATPGATSTSRIIKVTCDTIPSPLPSGIDINSKAVDSNAAITSTCVQCPNGRPVIHIYTDLTASPPPEIKMPANASIGQGSIAMGLCFSAPAYDHNAGVTGAAVDNRYDRWTISLYAVYLTNPISQNATVSQVTPLLKTITERIMLAAPEQLGSDINFTPK